MAYEKACEILHYIDEYIQRAKQISDAATEMQKHRPFAEWQVKAAKAIDESGSADARATADAHFAQLSNQLRVFLPMPQQPNITTHGTSTAVVSSNAAVFHEIVSWPVVAIAQNITPLVQEYNELQETQGRVSETRARLAGLFPRLVSFFDAAERTYHATSLKQEDWSHAATDMRNLLDKLQGELFDKARKHSGEKMDWNEMVARLTRHTTFEQLTLAQEHQRRSDLYKVLSDVTKYRGTVSGHPLADVWPRVVDHVFIVCGCVT